MTISINDISIANITSSSGVGVWDWDILNDRIDASATTGKLFGVSPASLETLPSLHDFSHALHPDDAEMFDLHIKRCRKIGGLFVMTYRTVVGADEARWILAQGQFEARPDGVVDRARGIVVDVTQGLKAGEIAPKFGVGGENVRRITSAEFVRSFSATCDQVMSEPVIVTRNGRDRLLVNHIRNRRV